LKGGGYPINGSSDVIDSISVMFARSAIGGGRGAQCSTFLAAWR
jgi:hypothetical protein